MRCLQITSKQVNKPKAILFVAIKVMGPKIACIMVNGWKNSGAPWSYFLYPERGRIGIFNRSYNEEYRIIAELALLATMLAPIDAAPGKAVVSNPLVPTKIRESLNVERGLM